MSTEQTFVGFSFRLVCIVKRDSDKRWIAFCPDLDVYSQGRTSKKAKKALAEAVTLWIEDCLERGTLDGALLGVGMEKES